MLSVAVFICSFHQAQNVRARLIKQYTPLRLALLCQRRTQRVRIEPDHGMSVDHRDRHCSVPELEQCVVSVIVFVDETNCKWVAGA